MIIDFRKTKTEIPELQAEQSPISGVSSYKLLGVWIDNNLKWETNTWALIKKGRKRLYFLKILRITVPSQRTCWHFIIQLSGRF